MDSNQTSDYAEPTLRLVVLNSLNLDTPSFSAEVQDETYEYVNTVITSSEPVEDRSSFTLLLTHLPLHKAAGVCVDAPFFDFYKKDDEEGRYRSGGLKEQNHLSDHVSRNGILEGIFGMSPYRNAAAEGNGRPGLILTGHDHEGCDVWHHIPRDDSQGKEGVDDDAEKVRGWQAVKWQDANFTASHTGIREVTLRSMMGEFHGNAGLLSAWFDDELGEWNFDIQNCEAGVQHIWWAVHILDIITLIVGFVYLVLLYFGSEIPIEVAEKSQERKEKEGTSGSHSTVDQQARSVQRSRRTRKT